MPRAPRLIFGQMNIYASSGNTVSLTNNGSITAWRGQHPEHRHLHRHGHPRNAGKFDGAGVGGSFVNDAGHTIRGRGTVECDLTNHGTLIAQSLSVTGRVLGDGPVNVVDDGFLAFPGDATAPLLQAGDLSMSPRASLYWNGEGTIDLKKNFTFSMTETGRFSASNPDYAHFQMSGGGATRQTLEVGGRDYGLAADGFSGNFNLGTLALAGAGTWVDLVDEVDNGQRGPGQHEAFYLNGTSSGTNLSVPPGTTLNLNRLHLYVYLDGIMHQVKAGEGNLFGGGEIINRPLKPVPLTGILMPLLLGD